MTTATARRTAKNITFILQTTTLYVHHAILYISLSPLHHYDMKLQPWFHEPALWSRWTQYKNCRFLFLNDEHPHPFHMRSTPSPGRQQRESYVHGSFEPLCSGATKRLFSANYLFREANICLLLDDHFIYDFLKFEFSHFTPQVRLFLVGKRKRKISGFKNVMERGIIKKKL